MQKYKYTALNLQKKKFAGTFMAENEKDLALQLAKQNLYLISCEPVSDKTPSAFLTVSGKIKLRELTTFCRQFSIMINSGISMLGTLSILKSQAFSSYFRKILEMIYEDVKGGLMLSEALNKHKRVFPEFFRSMVYVGEESGRLDKVLTSLADYYETDAAIRKKAKSALAYPTMLFFLTLGILIVMVAYVIPAFKSTLSTLEVPMPRITLIIYGISDFLLKWWKEIVLGIVAIVGALLAFKKTKRGRYFFDTLKIKTPIVKNVQINLITARFARGFGLLMESGMDVIEAMSVISIVLGNKNVERRFKQATEDVRHGMNLTMAFEAYKLFPQILTQIVSVGEKTNTIDEVLQRSCKFFDEQVESSLTSLTGFIQPVMLLFMGTVIATLFIALYSPLLNIMTTLT